MSELKAVRRLVKSPPELWTQCSDPAALARHLGDFGEITITRLEPESTVAWEGESVRGTVTLEASGWGTEVRLTAASPVSPDATAPLTAPVPGRTRLPRGVSSRLAGLLGRGWNLALRLEGEPAADTAHGRIPVTAGEPVPKTVAAQLLATLEAALDSLGQAHHRPYSRA